MSANIYFYHVGNEVWFHLDRESKACSKAIPFVFDGPATENHKSTYHTQYKEFLKSVDPGEPVEVKDPAIEVKEPADPQPIETKGKKKERSR